MENQAIVGSEQLGVGSEQLGVSLVDHKFPTTNCQLPTLISVIVPAYNVAAYLPRCLKSIVGQTYCNLEIIVVDDGSTDKTGSIAEEWAANDNRIRVIHQPNSGLSAARNTALDVAQGQYITCIDSDDFVNSEYVERLYQTLIEHDADMAVGSYIEFDDGTVPTIKPLPETPHYLVYSQADAINAVFYQNRLDHTAWGRLYRRYLFEGVRYPVGRLYEDIAVIYPILLKVKKVVLIDAPLYYYLQRPNSIIGRFSPKRADVLDLLDMIEEQVEPQYKPAVRSRKLSASFNMLRLLDVKDRQYDTLKQRSWLNIKSLRGSCLIDKHVRPKNKVVILISYLGLNILLKAINRR